MNEEQRRRREFALEMLLDLVERVRRGEGEVADCTLSKEPIAYSEPGCAEYTLRIKFRG